MVMSIMLSHYSAVAVPDCFKALQKPSGGAAGVKCQRKGGCKGGWSRIHRKLISVLNGYSSAFTAATEITENLYRVEAARHCLFFLN